MKRIIMAVAILCILIGIAANLPPKLPASFYGWVTGARAGQIVSVVVDRTIVAQTKIFIWEGSCVYAINVPMDNIADGKLAKLKIGGALVSSVALYSGTNRQLDLHLSGVRQR